MAYMRCASCNRTVSSKATKCPYCGQTPFGQEVKVPTEQTSDVRTKKKKAPVSQTRAKAEFKLPDKTKSNTIKRLIFHTIVSIVGYGIAFLLGGLLIDILEDLFAPALNLSTLSHTRAFLSGSSLVIGLIAGLAGPIATGAYVAGGASKKIVRARALPLQWCSLLYLLPAVASLVFYILSRAKLSAVVESNVGTDKEILTLSISFSLMVYYAIYTLGTFLKVMMSRCPECLHIDCKLKRGESPHITTHETETRERTVAGASYDVYTTSGEHVGTVQGPDSTVTQSRTVSTESWAVAWQCVHCGYRGSTSESMVKKTKWN